MGPRVVGTRCPHCPWDLLGPVCALRSLISVLLVRVVGSRGRGGEVSPCSLGAPRAKLCAEKDQFLYYGQESLGPGVVGTRCPHGPWDFLGPVCVLRRSISALRTRVIGSWGRGDEVSPWSLGPPGTSLCTEKINFCTTDKSSSGSSVAVCGWGSSGSSGRPGPSYVLRR